MIIFDIDRFSTHDGPGVRMAVFFKGCPLKCAWCHSPESQKSAPELIYRAQKCVNCGVCKCDAMPEPGKYIRENCRECFSCVKRCTAGALAVCGRYADVSGIIDIARRDADYYAHSGGGVTLTGGEILMQANSALCIIEELNRLSIHTAIETSGFGSYGALLKIAARADLIYYDIKHMSSEVHKAYTGVDNAAIFDNLRAIARENFGKIIVRVPLIPGVNDDENNIAQTKDFALSLSIPAVELLPYNHMAADKYAWVFAEYPLAAALN